MFGAGFMDKLLLCKFGELWLKSEQVKKKFLHQLVSNIKKNLYASGVKFSVRFDRNRVYVAVADKDCGKAVETLRNVFGLIAVLDVQEMETDFDIIKENVLKLAENKMKKKDTFAVRVKRTGSHKFTSQEFAATVGSWIAEKFKNKVDLTNPDVSFELEIRERKTYLILDSFSAAGGLPVGVEGNVVAIVNNKKDLYAARLIMKRGCNIIAVYSKENLDFDILKKHDLDTVFIRGDTKDYSLVDKIAKENDCKAVCTGETLDDLSDIDSLLDYPILRPLVGIDLGEYYVRRNEEVER